MPNPLADEARQMDDTALTSAVNEAYREVFNLNFQKGTHQLQDLTAIRRARRRIARLRTILRERELAIVAGAPLQPLAAAAPAPISPQRQRALDERAEAASALPEDARSLIPPTAFADDLVDDAVEDVELTSSAAAAAGDAETAPEKETS